MSILISNIGEVATGNSQIKGFENSFVISSYSFGAQLPQTNNGDYSGFPVLQMMSITRQTDTTSIQLIMAMAKQTTLQTIVMQVTKVVAGTPKAYLTITLKGAKVIGVNISASCPSEDAEASLAESFYIEYSSITVDFLPLSDDMASLGTSSPVTLNKLTKLVS